MSRIHVAFILYIALAAIAGSSLRGDFRTAVLVLLAGLALKTWIGHRKQLTEGIGPTNGTTPPGTIDPSTTPPDQQPEQS